MPNLKNGDVILLKDRDVYINEWPVVVVVNAIQSSDKKVRKAEVCIIKDGKRSVFTRPVTKLVLLLSDLGYEIYIIILMQRPVFLTFNCDKNLFFDF